MITNLSVYRLIDRLPWTLAGRLKWRFPAPTGYYFLVSKTPLIILIPEDFFEDPICWTPFFDSLKNRRVYFIGLVRSGIEFDPHAYKQLLSSVLAKHSHSYPEHSFVFLANNSAQTSIFDDLGIESVFVNQNCLEDETLFNVNSESSKQFDAIYNAVSAPYKRHELARRIESLAIITYLQSQHLPYFEKTTTILGHAKWLNFPEGQVNSTSYSRIANEGICSLLNQARVGLCLSHVEGAMFASIEYLLAGLPVVSTYSYGGRDVFFDDEYVAIVDADPEAVKAGVDRMIERNLDPYMIRAATLQKMEEHRQRFVNMIRSITAREGLEADIQSIYTMTFPNKIYKLRPLHKILDYI